MARKKSNMLASVMASAASGTSGASDTIVQNAENTAVEDKAEKIEIQQEVKYDDVADKSKELVRLSKELSEMTDKIASYIDEINDLKLKNQKLQDDYDNSLMKISELTFEIAELRAKSSDFQENPSKKFLKPIEVRQSTTVPYTHPIKCNQNGYSDWN